MRRRIPLSMAGAGAIVIVGLVMRGFQAVTGGDLFRMYMLMRVMGIRIAILDDPLGAWSYLWFLNLPAWLVLVVFSSMLLGAIWIVRKI